MANVFASTGLPVFYLPTPDPTSVDVLANPNIALTFTEAALPELIGEDGQVCGGTDPEDPTCAHISLHGTARELDEHEIEYVLKSFGTTHPRASWLASGGGHTGGSYFTLELTGMEFFRNYGGMAKITVDDYLNWKPEYSSDFDKCAPRPKSSEIGTPPGGDGNASSGKGYMQHGSGEGGGMQHESAGQTHSSDGQSSAGDKQANGSTNENSSDGKGASFTLSYGFMSGTIFGFMLWGPTIALVVYHKLRAEQSYSPVAPAATTIHAQIL